MECMLEYPWDTPGIPLEYPADTSQIPLGYSKGIPTLSEGYLKGIPTLSEPYPSLHHITNAIQTIPYLGISWPVISII